MRTFDYEETVTKVSVFHDSKLVAFKEVDFFGDVSKLRDARKEAALLVQFLRENPEAETVPLREGWRLE